MWDSYENHLKPIIDREYNILQQNNKKGRLIVAGFSQGCGMSLHCLSNSRDKIDAALGIAGYLFPITKMDVDLSKRVRIINGLND